METRNWDEMHFTNACGFDGSGLLNGRLMITGAYQIWTNLGLFDDATLDGSLDAHRCLSDLDESGPGHDATLDVCGPVPCKMFGCKATSDVVMANG